MISFASSRADTAVVSNPDQRVFNVEFLNNVRFFLLNIFTHDNAPPFTEYVCTGCPNSLYLFFPSSFSAPAAGSAQADPRSSWKSRSPSITHPVSCLTISISAFILPKLLFLRVFSTPFLFMAIQFRQSSFFCRCRVYTF